jgi:mRNA-degrading endonuclease toxin of MazEF toxin-antitoxin module
MPEHTRSMSRRRLIRKLGIISPDALAAVEDRLRDLLEL